ncbi:hypothetical protein SprV_0301245600 [Sparganum proliferum]
MQDIRMDRKVEEVQENDELRLREDNLLSLHQRDPALLNSDRKMFLIDKRRFCSAGPNAPSVLNKSPETTDTAINRLP